MLMQELGDRVHWKHQVIGRRPGEPRWKAPFRVLADNLRLLCAEPIAQAETLCMVTGTERRLLFVTAESHPSHRVDVAVLFGKYLPRLGIGTVLVAAATPQDAAVPWGGGPAALAVGKGGPLRRHLRTMAHAVRQAWHARRWGCSAIQVRDMPVTAALLLLVARLRGLPFYYWMSFPKPEGQIQRARDRGLRDGSLAFAVPWLRGRLWRFVLYRLVLPRANHVFVQSEQMKLDLAKRGLPLANMTPVPMGVDLAAIEAAGLTPSDDPRLAGRRVLVYLGAMDQARRIDLLFDMLWLVRQQVPDVLLVLVGEAQDKTHRAWLRQRAQGAGVDDALLWTGWLPMSEGWRYVLSSEIGLSPIPRGEVFDCGSPTKLPEYLMLGIPVVCNDNPDQAALLEASGAGICVPYTAADFARATISLLRLPAAQRQAMADLGRAHLTAHRDYAVLAATLAASYGALLA